MLFSKILFQSFIFYVTIFQLCKHVVFPGRHRFVWSVFVVIFLSPANTSFSVPLLTFLSWLKYEISGHQLTSSSPRPAGVRSWWLVDIACCQLSGRAEVVGEEVVWRSLTEGRVGEGQSEDRSCRTWRLRMRGSRGSQTLQSRPAAPFMEYWTVDWREMLPNWL